MIQPNQNQGNLIRKMAQPQRVNYPNAIGQGLMSVGRDLMGGRGEVGKMVKGGLRNMANYLNSYDVQKGQNDKRNFQKANNFWNN